MLSMFRHFQIRFSTDFAFVRELRFVAFLSAKFLPENQPEMLESSTQKHVISLKFSKVKYCSL